MKKTILLVLLFIMSFSFCSCEKNSDNNIDDGSILDGEIEDDNKQDDEIVDDTNKEDDSSKDEDQTPPVNTEEEDRLFFEKVENYVRSFIKENTRKDLNLKKSYYSSGAVMTYVSSKPEFVTNDGKYIEHEYDEEVTLTCTITWGEKTHSFDINITSVGIPDDQKLEKVKAWVENRLSKIELKEGTVLPNTHPDYGGRIRWICEDPGLIVDYQTLNLPTERGTYRLLAEYYFNNAYEIVAYPVYLNATKLSANERIINFIKQSFIPTQGSFINLYEGSSPIINTDYLIDIEDENIKDHLHSGYKPLVSQDFLDEEIYEGYKLKNKEQVVWVVVHESGMNTTGVDAEYLAKAQWNYAYNGSSSNASWNYQVDDGAVYQSYGDDVYCWHASSRRGNSNSIGIEMCVNPDGQFNAAMRNDARLIAYFLRTYELGMMNVKQHYNFDSKGKNCPENIRNDFRWFELLGMISREYFSQEYLKDVDITYNFKSGNAKDWKLSGVYQLTDKSEVIVEVTVFDETFTISTTNE